MTKQIVFSGFEVSLAEKLEASIYAMKLYESHAVRLDHDCGYYGAFSGGKDSVVVKEVARLAGVKIHWTYNVTTIDPPELVRFIRRHHHDVAFSKPEKSFFELLVMKGYPIRSRRWCCVELKEKHGCGKIVVTGVRANESQRRKKQARLFSEWKQGRVTEQATYMLNPILCWSNSDVWQFIRERGLPYCELYDEGFSRLGCVGCPMGGAKQVNIEFERWPAIAAAWRRAFHKLWERRAGTPITRGKRRGQLWPGMPGIENADQLFEWWKSGDAAPIDVADDELTECQLGFW